MPTFRVRVFEIPEAYEVGPGGKLPKPEEIPGFAVEGDNIDVGRDLAQKRLGDWGRKVRSISCLADGTAELAAIVYPLKQKG